MVVYDDAAIDGAVRIYDRGVDFTEPSNFGEYQLTYRSGDMLVPRLDAAEPLGLELADFARAIKTGTEPRSHARLGVEIVRILEAAHASLTSSGQPVPLGTPAVSNVRRLVPGDASVRDFTRARAADRTARAA